MQKLITISNSTGAYYELAYRMPGQLTQILSVNINPYALMQKVTIPSEECYLQFKKQNAHYFLGPKPILTEGHVSAGKLEKINKDLEAEETETISSEIKNFDNQIESSADEVSGKIEVEIRKEKKETKGKKGRMR